MDLGRLEWLNDDAMPVVAKKDWQYDSVGQCFTAQQWSLFF
jgi:hypothetical protein